MTVSELAPDVSSWPIITIDCSALSPSSWNAVAFCTRPFASVSTEAPVACPVAVSASRSPSALSAPSPKADRAFCTVSTELVTSVPFIFANLINWPESFSSSSPVTPNRVLTSPIASPAVAKSVGIVVVRFLRISVIPSRASPDAPVFCTIVSSPSSTDFQDAIAAVPTAVRGAVSPFVSVDPALPIFLPIASDMDAPATLPAADPAGCAASVRSFVMVC